MTDDVLAAIRSVSDRARNEITSSPSETHVEVDSREGLLLAALAARVDPGGVDLSEARLRTVRRALLKLIRPATESQSAFNADVHRAMAQVMDAVRADRTRLNAIGAGLTSVELFDDVADSRISQLEQLAGQKPTRTEFEALNGMVHHLGQRIDDLVDLVARVDARLERSQAELARHRAVVDLTMRELRATLPDEKPDVSAVTRPLDESYDRFYEDFEAALRGSREQLLAQQREYVDLVSDSPGPVLDIGPGRGEWLELLGEVGIEARGVDINSKFVEGCRSRGLDVVHGDAFDHLREIPECSLGAITAFQVVEHLPFESLVDLLGLCLVALRPGGVLIMETPNPSNLKVGAMTFWNDPSHVHPLPPHLLEFLVRWRGFVDVTTRFPGSDPRRALEIAGVESAELDDLNWAMFGPLDYAIVARRA